MRAHALSRIATQRDCMSMAGAGSCDESACDGSAPETAVSGAVVSGAVVWAATLVECADWPGCPVLCIAKTLRASTATSSRCPRRPPVRARRLTVMRGSVTDRSGSAGTTVPKDRPSCRAKGRFLLLY